MSSGREVENRKSRMRERATTVVRREQAAIIGRAVCQSHLYPFDHGPRIQSSGFSNHETGYATHGISSHSKISPADVQR